MIFIINRMEQKALRYVVEDIESKTNVSAEVAGVKIGLVHTSNPDLKDAIHSRFPEGEYTLNDREIAKQFFVVKKSSVVIVDDFNAIKENPEQIFTDGVEIGPISRENNTEGKPTEFHPKNLVVVIQPIKGDTTPVITIDGRNLTANATVTVDNAFTVSYYIIRWTNWSRLRYPVYVEVDGAPLYKLGCRRINGGKYFQDDVVAMTKEETEEAVQAKKENAQVTEKAKREKRPVGEHKPYHKPNNNQRDDKGNDRVKSAGKPYRGNGSKPNNFNRDNTGKGKGPSNKFNGSNNHYRNQGNR